MNNPSPHLLNQAQISPPPFLAEVSPWVTHVLNTLSPRERIGQLIHVASWSNRDAAHEEHVLRLIAEFGIGGVIFFQGDPVSQAKMTNTYQAQSKVPLMISIDAEWGLAMRLDNCVQYPYQVALGAANDPKLVYEMGVQLARQCKRLGIHVNFAPCVDINTNPANPVIGFRSFGRYGSSVIKQAYAYMKGMQDEGILAVAKHFPGHGDTAQDSHFHLPSIAHDEKRLHEVELFPYKLLIPLGLGGVMPGHLRVPIWDDHPYRGATLSHAITQKLLKEDLGFEGLVFTDALDMKAVTNHFPPGQIEVEALLAGNDVLLFSVEVEKAINGIEAAISAGQISQAEVDARCKKLLAAKAWLGLEQYSPIEIEGLVDELNPAAAQELNRSLAQKSILIHNQEKYPQKFRPKRSPKNAQIATVAFQLGSANIDPELAHHQLTKTQSFAATSEDLTIFQQHLSLSHASITHFQLKPPFDPQYVQALYHELEGFERIFLSLHGLEIKARNRFGLTDETIAMLTNGFEGLPITPVLFGSEYVLEHLGDFSLEHETILAWQESIFAQEAAAKHILQHWITAH